MKEVRLGIIGTGIIAQQHLTNYSKLPGVKVVMACDLIQSKLEAFCEKFGIAEHTLDYRELLKRDDIEAVDVCVHNNLHAPLSIEVMKAGKHCYCEKPMAGSYADALAMYEASKKLGRMLHIQLGYLYRDETRAAKKLIEAGELGTIYHARSTGYRRRGRPFVDGYGEKEFDSRYWAEGGALYDMAVYHISQLLYLLGLPKLERVSGQVYQELPMDEKRRKESGFNVEELGVGFAKYAGNLTFDVLESWAIQVNQFDGSFLAGTKGGVRFEPFGYYSTLADMTMSSTFDLKGDDYRTHQLDPSLSGMDSSQQHWVAALRGEMPLINSAQVALETMLLSEGIYQSGKLGREVTADEIKALTKSSALHTQETPFGVLKYAPHPFL